MSEQYGPINVLMVEEMIEDNFVKRRLLLTSESNEVTDPVITTLVLIIIICVSARGIPIPVSRM